MNRALIHHLTLAIFRVSSCRRETKATTQLPQSLCCRSLKHFSKLTPASASALNGVMIPWSPLQGFPTLQKANNTNHDTLLVDLVPVWEHLQYLVPFSGIGGSTSVYRTLLFHPQSIHGLGHIRSTSPQSFVVRLKKIRVSDSSVNGKEVQKMEWEWRMKHHKCSDQSLM